ncbi:hypothetical protein [Aureimonas psammosilenae]|uniref:hypothetical protein n=1 Tax=Aureimonas psammosilenae TaxID=2495496 RepID=UPI001260D34A|nr:hypothetical protein [Aureimonas psammosilenae]
MTAPVSPIFGKGHVLIDAGRCTDGDDASLVGKWVYVVALVDGDGSTLHNYIGPDRHAADTAAVGLARDFGIRIVDRSTEPAK